MPAHAVLKMRSGFIAAGGGFLKPKTPGEGLDFMPQQAGNPFGIPGHSVIGYNSNHLVNNFLQGPGKSP